MSSSVQPLDISTSPVEESTTLSGPSFTAQEKENESKTTEISAKLILNDGLQQYEENLIERLSSVNHMEGNDCGDRNVCKGLPHKHLLCFLPEVNKICPKSCGMC